MLSTYNLFVIIDPMKVFYWEIVKFQSYGLDIAVHSRFSQQCRNVGQKEY
jgi:hypothetical protein